jgi:hypothetical protein
MARAWAVGPWTLLIAAAPSLRKKFVFFLSILN